MKTYVLKDRQNRVLVTISGKSGGFSIESELKDNSFYDSATMEFNAAMDGIESLLLAMACEGIDVGTPEVQEALCTALDSCAQNFPEENDNEDD